MPRLVDVARAARRCSRTAITPRRRLALALAASGGGALVSCTCGTERATCTESSSGTADAAAVMAAPMLAAVGAAAYLFGRRSDDGGSPKVSPHVDSERVAAEKAGSDLAVDKLQDDERAAIEGPECERVTSDNALELGSSSLARTAPSEPQLLMASDGPAINSGPDTFAQGRKSSAPPKRRRKLRANLTEADARAIMEEFDVNRDGRIDKDELMSLAYSVGLALDQQDVEACVRALDADGDGSIDEFELARWLVQQDADGDKLVSNAPYELRARLIAHRCGRALSRQANLVTARLLLGDDADEHLAEAAIQRANGNGGLGGTPKSLEESERIRACLDEVSLLDSLSRVKKERLVQAFTSRHYKASEVIFTQGQVGDAFYILQRGACRVIQHDAGGGDIAAVKELRLLRAGAHFGELALKNNTPRSATVEAIENSLVLKLKVADFKAILGPLLHAINFTEWATADKIVSGNRVGGGGSAKSPPKLGPKAARGHGDVFNAGSPLEVYRYRKVAEYESRLRRLSSPGKVFAYFATVETEDGEQMMLGTDFLAALGVLHPHVVAGQQDQIDKAGKHFTTMLTQGGTAKASNGMLISYAEFRFFRSLLSIRPSDLEMAFQMFDCDEDGSIDCDEFIHMFSILSEQSSAQTHGVAGALFDKVNQWSITEGHHGRAVHQSRQPLQTSSGNSAGGVSFQEFAAWLTTLQYELVRLEFLNWATDSSGDGKVDSLSASDFGRMVVHLVSSAGHSVKEHRRRRAEMSDKLAVTRIGLAEFAQFSAVLAQLEQVEAAVGLSTLGGTGRVDRNTLERAVDAAFAGQLALPATIIEVLFTVLDADGDGWLSTDELFGTLRERRATNGAALDRGSAYSCFSACLSGG